MKLTRFFFAFFFIFH
ncbi:hypothetical protein ATS58_004615 [Salmonella enterica subsp. enterica serovar Pensacola]|nr:hypothetical protein [Salmonella enterica subsp. enterica serovar Pensacola]